MKLVFNERKIIYLIFFNYVVCLFNVHVFQAYLSDSVGFDGFDSYGWYGGKRNTDDVTTLSKHENIDK